MKTAKERSIETAQAARRFHGRTLLLVDMENVERRVIEHVVRILPEAEPRLRRKILSGWVPTAVDMFALDWQEA